VFKSLFGPPSIVGVDVGTHSIKILEVAVSSKRLTEVRKAAEAETPPGYSAGQVPDVQALGQTLRQAFRSAKIRSRRVALAVPAQVGFVRKLMVPVMPEKELRAAIDLQPDRYIPFARDGVVYDLHLLPGPAPEGQMWAVIAAAPRKCVSDLMAACKAAGLKVVRVDLEPLALYRAALATEQAAPDQGVCLVDLGSESARISLFEGGIPIISRTIDMPRSSVEGVADPFAGVATEDLFYDIRRSLEFALTKTAQPPSRVLIAGGFGNDAYVALSLTAYLRGFLAERLPAGFRVEAMQDPAQRVPLAHMLAFGLALPPELYA